MKTIHYFWAGVIVAGALLAGAIAQQVSGPPRDAALVCAYNSSPPAITDGTFAYAQCDSSGHFLTSGPTRVTLGQSRLPMILPSSGSMGNNGALTLTTALDQAYPAAYFYMPAGAIAAASTAGFYYGTMSSTTAVTLFNNPYVSGTPTIPASPTAFATTGPGAYTQTTGSAFTAYTYSVPGGTLGAFDEVQAHGNVSYNNSAGAKTFNLSYGTFTFGTAAPTTTTHYPFQGGFANTGIVTRQTVTSPSTMLLSAAVAGVPSVSTQNSANALSLSVTLQLAVATDYVMLRNVVFEQIKAANN